jgi:hypothetical protein
MTTTLMTEHRDGTVEIGPCGRRDALPKPCGQLDAGGVGGEPCSSSSVFQAPVVRPLSGFTTVKVTTT